MRTLLPAFLLLLCSPLLADYREGHGGWTHPHNCEGSKNPNCSPHHHYLKLRGIDLATRETLSDALAVYNRTVGLPKKVIEKGYYEFSEKIKEKFILFFEENPRELLEVIPKSLGNAPSGCIYAPPKEVSLLEHSEEECERFKSGTPKPHSDPNKPRIPRPRIEDFIDEYVGREKDRI
ncbi:MAG: hypothetical protein ACOH5I_23325 [Oligoflexus sp.]